MITRNWALVELIAKELFDKKKLTKKDIESLMKRCHVELIKTK